MLAPPIQPRQAVPLFRRISATPGLWAMWAGFARLVAAVVVAAMHPLHRHHGWELAALYIPFDVLFGPLTLIAGLQRRVAR